MAAADRRSGVPAASAVGEPAAKLVAELLNSGVAATPCLPTRVNRARAAQLLARSCVARGASTIWAITPDHLKAFGDDLAAAYARFGPRMYYHVAVRLLTGARAALWTGREPLPRLAIPAPPPQSEPVASLEGLAPPQRERF